MDRPLSLQLDSSLYCSPTTIIEIPTEKLSISDVNMTLTVTQTSILPIFVLSNLKKTEENCKCVLGVLCFVNCFCAFFSFYLIYCCESKVVYKNVGQFPIS